jgi:DNA-binding MarR family transcriptional regulator
MDKVTVNRACKILAERQLIERKPHGSDRRSHQLQLTKAGHDLHTDIMPLAMDIEERLLTAISAHDAAMLTHLLKLLRETSQNLGEQRT